MALNYKRLADVRIDLPHGRESIVPRKPPGITLREPRPGDLELLLRTTEQEAVDEANHFHEDVSSRLLLRTDEFEFRNPSISAQTSHNQLLRFIEAMSRNDPNHETDTLQGGVEEASNPHVFTLSLDRWEASRVQRRFACYFDAIRILVLLPGTTQNPICCTTEIAYLRHREEDLEVQDDNPMGKDPEYEALSYCWGDLNDKAEIHVDGVSVQVAKSLETALRNLRRATKPRRLWIDALCIDQSNDREKSIQVARMFEIYEQASCVLVWLGPSSEDSDLALRTLKSLGSVDGEMEAENIYQEHPGDGEILWIKPIDRSKLRDACTLSSEEKTALENIFSTRKWWTRRWIIQEIAYAARAYLVCGSLMLDWDVLSNVLRLNDSIGIAFKGCQWLRNPAILEQQRHEAHFPDRHMRRRGSTLRALVAQLQDFNCSNPYDWIYCIVGLRSCPPEIQADYTKTVRDVFIEATKLMIRNRNAEQTCQNASLNVICAAYRDSSSEHNLPSWVPDWSKPCTYWLFDLSEDDEQFYKCSGDEEFLHDLSFPQNDRLRCKVVMVDRIKVICGDQPWNYRDEESYYKKVLSTLVKWVDMLKDNSPQDQTAGQQTIDEWVPQIARYTTWQDVLLAWLAFMRSAEEEDTIKIPSRIIDDLPGTSFLQRWQLGITTQNFFGLVPQTSAENDYLAILYGANVPVILRRLDPSEDSDYRLIGPACIHGIMQGEILESLDDSTELQPQHINLV